MGDAQHMTYNDLVVYLREKHGVEMTVASLRTLYSRAQKRREAGVVRLADMPEAVMMGRTPTWSPKVIDRWRANVAGPGRPKQQD